MDKRDVAGVVGGVAFALIWLLLTRDPLQSASTGIIFAIAWLAGRRYSENRRRGRR